jgi:hypothetical protein
MPLQNGFVLRVPAPAEAVVLERGAGVADDRPAMTVEQGDASGDPVGPVLGDLDGLLAVLLGPLAGHALLDGEAQRTGWARLNGADDLVHPAAARCDERVGLAPEHGRQAVGAEP